MTVSRPVDGCQYDFSTNARLEHHLQTDHQTGLSEWTGGDQ